MFDSVPLPRDDQLPEYIRNTLREFPPLHIFRILANVPDSFHPYIQLAQSLYKGALDPRSRQMALLRAAYRLPCKYLQNLYIPMCKNLGASDREIQAVLSETSVTSLHHEANFLCKAADEITLKATVSDETFRELYQKYSIEEGSKVLLMLSTVNMIGRFINATRLPLETTDPLQGSSSFFK